MSRLRAAIQHFHRRLRVDQNYYITQHSKTAIVLPSQEQLLAKQSKIFKQFYSKVEPEYERFRKQLSSRSQDTSTRLPETVNNFSFSSEESPFFTLFRHSPGTEKEQIFSLAQIATIHKIPRSKLQSVQAPIIRLNDDYTKLLYIVDILGNDRPVLGLKDLKTRKYGPTIDLACNAYWTLQGDAFYYTVPNEANRPYRIYRRSLNSADTALVFQEPNPAFFLDLSQTKDNKYTIISSQSRTAAEIHMIDRKTKALSKVAPKEHNARYFIEHNKGWFYLVTNHRRPDFRVVRVPVGGHISNAQEFIPYSEGMCYDEVDMFEGHLVVYGKQEGVPIVKVFDIKTGTFSGVDLGQKEQVFSLEPGANMNYNSSSLRVYFSSPTTPQTSYTIDLNTATASVSHTLSLKGRRYDPADFVCKRLQAPSHDGLNIPITLFHHKHITPNQRNRLLLAGYGAYGIRTDHSFKYSQMTAAQEGWVIATAHPRGEGEKGEPWHLAGKLYNKQNSFLDYLSCAAYLIGNGYTRPEFMAAYGASAGGMLVAQSINMKPQIFKAAVLEVPFVDVLGNMLDEDSPLTVPDREEWGDPLRVTVTQDARAFDEIKSYSPYENLSVMKYPYVFVRAGRDDSRVPLHSILKYMKRLRERHLSGEDTHWQDNLVLEVEETGHFGEGNLDSEAKVWAFLNYTIPPPPP